MNRRRYLLTAGSVGSAISSGCLGRSSRRKGLSVEGSGPTLEPGTITTISATAYNADTFRFRAPDLARLDETDASVSPSPDRQYDSFPPVWMWDEPKSTVDAELTVAVPSDADTGEYTYGITAGNGSKQQEAKFTVAVES